MQRIQREKDRAIRKAEDEKKAAEEKRKLEEQEQRKLRGEVDEEEVEKESKADAMERFKEGFRAQIKEEYA